MRKNFYFFLLFVFLGWGYTNPVLAQWVQTNGPYGGNIKALVATPGGTLFAAVGTYGVYRSTDGGKSWMPVNTGLTNPDVRSLVISPDDSTLFAGTWGSGVFRSTDNGASWIPINSGLTNLNLEVRSLAVSPDDSTLYAGTYGKYGQGELYRYDGSSWSQIGQTDIFGIVGSLAVSPDDSTVFASIVTGGEVYRSTDYGASWTTVNTGFTYAGVTSIAVSPDDSTVFLGTGLKGVLRSTDNGKNWSQLNTGLTNTVVTSVAISPDGTTLFAGADGGAFYYNGISWIQAGLPDFQVNFLLVFPHKSIFAGTLSGIFHSTDNGKSWSEADSGMVKTTGGVFSLAADSDNSTIAAATGTAVFLTTDKGENWTHIGFGGNYSEVVFSSDGENLYALGQYSILHYIQNGSGWLNSGTISNDNSFVALAVARGDTLFAGTNGYGVYLYDGKSWYQTGLTNHYITSLVSIPNSSVVIAVTYSNGIFRSTNDGKTWTKADNGLTNIFVHSLTFSPEDSTLFAGTDGGVFRSTDKGISWTPINTGLTDKSIYSLAVTTDGSMLFAVVAHGMFSYDGKSWSKVDTTGLANHHVTTVAVASDGSGIFAGTVVAGVWRHSISSLTPIETAVPVAPARFALNQNYPNPFNPSTNISFKISSPGLVTLKIYDVLGREVATLVNRRMSPGSYDVRWNASGFASGVYFYRLRAGNVVQVKKMLYLK